MLFFELSLRFDALALRRETTRFAEARREERLLDLFGLLDFLGDGRRPRDTDRRGAFFGCTLELGFLVLRATLLVLLPLRFAFRPLGVAERREVLFLETLRDAALFLETLRDASLLAALGVALRLAFLRATLLDVELRLEAFGVLLFRRFDTLLRLTLRLLDLLEPFLFGLLGVAARRRLLLSDFLRPFFFAALGVFALRLDDLRFLDFGVALRLRDLLREALLDLFGAFGVLERRPFRFFAFGVLLRFLLRRLTDRDLELFFGAFGVRALRLLVLRFLELFGVLDFLLRRETLRLVLRSGAFGVFDLLFAERLFDRLGALGVRAFRLVLREEPFFAALGVRDFLELLRLAFFGVAERLALRALRLREVEALRLGDFGFLEDRRLLTLFCFFLDGDLGAPLVFVGVRARFLPMSLFRFSSISAL